MLLLVSPLVVAQVVTAPILPILPLARQYITQPQEIRSLPGQLNDVSVFNSNSPEVVQREGILLSTFPANGKRFPNAHLAHPLNGRFDLFSHHIARSLRDKRTLYQGVIINNPTGKTVTIQVLQAASYLTSPDAPFIDLPPQVEDPIGRVFSGPGSRLMGDILRGVNQANFPRQIIIPPYQNRVLFSLPISASAARSTFMRLQSNGPVYMANLAMYSIAEFPKPPIANIITQEDKNGKITLLPILPIPPAAPVFREPTLTDWQGMLIRGRLVEPRDRAPTRLDNIVANSQPIYGRVAGISVGSEWIAKLVDRPGNPYLSIPQKGQAFSYPLSTVNVGTHGTRQVQSAPMLVRYPDTAFRAHGNYAVRYNFTLPLRNNTADKQTVTLSLQTPFKQDQYSDRLFFSGSPQGSAFFRGTVRVSYVDERGQTQMRYFHLIQRQGQQGNALVTLNMLPGEQREVNLDFFYPPDATPPQVITVRSLELFYGRLR